MGTEKWICTVFQARKKKEYIDRLLTAHDNALYSVLTTHFVKLCLLIDIILQFLST